MSDQKPTGLGESIKSELEYAIIHGAAPGKDAADGFRLLDKWAEDYITKLAQHMAAKAPTGKTLTKNRYGEGVYHGYNRATRELFKILKGENNEQERYNPS